MLKYEKNEKTSTKTTNALINGMRTGKPALHIANILIERKDVVCLTPFNVQKELDFPLRGTKILVEMVFEEK